MHENDCIYKESEPHLLSFIACRNMNKNNGSTHVHGNECIYKEAERHFSPFIACNNMKITTDPCFTEALSQSWKIN